MRKSFSKPATIVSALLVTTSCSLFTQKTFDWFVATKNNTRINYVLLIGQNEHTDSIERTRWTRETLHTRDKATEINDNANLGIPTEGYINLYGGEGVEPLTHLIVNEIEHGEQKSLAGIAWDPITANNSMNTWLCKHNTDIGFVVSNNDCMAEGAMMASNWIKDLPIIGYDANASAIERIADPNNNSLLGTIDQNTASQTSSMCLLARNILDDLDAVKKGHKEDAHMIINEDDKYNTDYNPLYSPYSETKNNRGFGGEDSSEHKGYYIKGFEDTETPDIDEGLMNPLPFNNLKLNYYHQDDDNPASGAHQILSKSFAIDKDNVDDFMKGGSAKTPDDLAFETYVKPDGNSETSYSICMTINSSSDVYLNTTLLPYTKVYAPYLKLNLDTPIMGNGSDEEKMLKEIASRGSKYDAYFINMATTGDGMSFITTIAPQAFSHEKRQGKIPSKGWDKFDDRLNTPLIFYNKQPMTSEGKIDYDVMNNKYFKYTYYVGSSAEQGGKEQGKLIQNVLNSLYVNAMKEKKR